MDPKIYGHESAELWETSVRPKLENGIPFRHNGRDSSGLDCVGLLIWAYRECGFLIPEPPETGKYPANFWRTPSPIGLLPGLRPYAEPVQPAQMVSGDIFVFHTNSRASHVGILDGTTFWHATEESGVVRDRIVTSEWSLRLRCVMRLRSPLLSKDPDEVARCMAIFLNSHVISKQGPALDTMMKAFGGGHV